MEEDVELNLELQPKARPRPPKGPPPRHLIQAKVDTATEDAAFLARRTRYERGLGLLEKDAEALRKLPREAAELLMDELPVSLQRPLQRRQTVLECLRDPLFPDVFKGLQEVESICNVTPAELRALPYPALQEIFRMQEQAKDGGPSDAFQLATKVRCVMARFQASADGKFTGPEVSTLKVEEDVAEPPPPRQVPPRPARLPASPLLHQIRAFVAEHHHSEAFVKEVETFVANLGMQPEVALILQMLSSTAAWGVMECSRAGDMQSILDQVHMVNPHAASLGKQLLAGGGSGAAQYVPPAAPAWPASPWGHGAYPQWPYAGAPNYGYWVAWAAKAAADAAAKKAKKHTRRSKKDKKEKDGDAKGKKRRRETRESPKKKKKAKSSSSSSANSDDRSGAAPTSPAKAVKSGPAGPGHHTAFGPQDVRAWRLAGSRFLHLRFSSGSAPPPAARPKSSTKLRSVNERFSDLMLGIEEESDSDSELSSSGQGATAADLYDPEPPPQPESRQPEQAGDTAEACQEAPQPKPSSSEEAGPPDGAAPSPAAVFGASDKEAKLLEWLRSLDGGRGALVQYFSKLKEEFDSDFHLLASVRRIGPANGLLHSVDPAFWEVCGVKQLGHRLLFAKGLRALP